MTNAEEPENKKTEKLKSTSIFTNKVALLFVVVFAAIGAYLLFSANAAKPVRNAVTLSLVPASQRLQLNQTFTVEVHLNTNNQAVNAVQADLNYPIANLEFVSIDASGSAFNVEAPSSGGSGTVSIARGSITPLTSSDLLVARVTFKAVASDRKVPISFASTSVVMRAEDSVDILQSRKGGQYNIQ